MKTCTTCKVAKPFTEYYKDKGKPDGLYSRCKPCHKESCGKWGAANKEKRNQQAKDWRAKNLEKARIASLKCSKRRYLENPEAAKARTKAWYQANKDRALAYHKENRKVRAEYLKNYSAEYYAKNSEKIKVASRANALVNREKNRSSNTAKSRAYFSKKLKSTPSWANLSAIKAIYSDAAAISKATGIKHHVDHIVPLRSKLVCGLHCEANLEIVPAKKNQSKGNRFWPNQGADHILSLAR